MHIFTFTYKFVIIRGKKRLFSNYKFLSSSGKNSLLHTLFWIFTTMQILLLKKKNKLYCV